MEEYRIRPIAHMRSDFPEKFGIPRQSGLVDELRSLVVFEEDYARPEALREIEGFSHLWLIWQFSRAPVREFRPTVRPPRLGGNRRVGVFASRSPYRPNGLGLSCVRLLEVRQDAAGLQLLVAGADLLDGTPIFDIKPYIPYTDSHPDALPGYTAYTREHRLQVSFPEDLLERVPGDRREALLGVLAGDPRPGYQDAPEEMYGLAFGRQDIAFTVRDGILRVTDVREKEE